MKTISVSNFELVTSSAADEARSQRDQLLYEAGNVGLVTDASSHLAATETLRTLRNFAKMIKEGHEVAKAPVLQLGRDLDSLWHELADAVDAEGKRIGNALGSYNLEQEKIARQKREDAAREEQRLKDEAAEKQRKADEQKQADDKKAADDLAAETKRIADEAAAKIARARTETGREKAREGSAIRLAQVTQAAAVASEKRAEAVEEKKDEIFQAATVAVAETRQTLAVATAKPKGTSTKEDVEYEIEDIEALREAAPYLCTVTENKQALKTALKGMRRDQKMPGVRHWWTASTITRG